jgi:hypothetical protein
VRECLPAEVLFYYDRLNESEPELLECPEVFAMAVLVSTYRSLSPGGRKKLVNHFAIPPSAGCGCNLGAVRFQVRLQGHRRNHDEKVSEPRPLRIAGGQAK